jgi:hypothetical protein
MNLREMTMNTKQMIAAALLFSAAGAVFAQQADQTTNGFLGTEASVSAASNTVSGQPQNVISTGKTRAEVVAELKQAEKDGTLQTGSFAGFRNPVENATQATAPQAIATK